MKTTRQLKKVQECEKTLRRIHYEVGKLYRLQPTYKNSDAVTFFFTQPGELGYDFDHPVRVNSILLCIESNYLVEKPHFPGGVSWPISNFNGLTQGNLFLYDNHIFFISIANTYYTQHIILKEVKEDDVY